MREEFFRLESTYNFNELLRIFENIGGKECGDGIILGLMCIIYHRMGMNAESMELYKLYNEWVFLIIWFFLIIISFIK